MPSTHPTRPANRLSATGGLSVAYEPRGFQTVCPSLVGVVAGPSEIHAGQVGPAKECAGQVRVGEVRTDEVCRDQGEFRIAGVRR